MIPDPIHQLLHEADERNVANLSDAGKLADGVWRRVRQQRRQRVVMTAGVIATVIVLGMLGLSMRSGHRETHAPQVTAGDPPQSVQLAELAKLQREIGARELRINQMIATERLEKSQARLAAILPELNDDPAARAAAVVVRQGDMMRDAGLKGDASNSYGQVISYFPKTPAAELAKQRLALLETKG